MNITLSGLVMVLLEESAPHLRLNMQSIMSIVQEEDRLVLLFDKYKIVLDLHTADVEVVVVNNGHNVILNINEVKNMNNFVEAVTLAHSIAANYNNDQVAAYKKKAMERVAPALEAVKRMNEQYHRGPLAPKDIGLPPGFEDDSDHIARSINVKDRNDSVAHGPQWTTTNNDTAHVSIPIPPVPPVPAIPVADVDTKVKEFTPKLQTTIIQDFLNDR